MKNLFLALLLIMTVFAISGCERDSETLLITYAPEPPQGVMSITGDNAVYIFFDGPYLQNISEYIVKRSLSADVGYQEIGIVPALYNPSLDLIHYEFVDNTVQNGVTYFYAVSTVDNSGRESALSAETVFDTPRPEGAVVLFDPIAEASLSGFALAAQATVAWDSPAADVYLDSDVDGNYYINAANLNTDLQDMGFHESFDEVGWAPQDGWSAIGYQELLVGHIYVIWTDDLHFAKMQVTSLNSTSVSFLWAYQTVVDYPELAPRLESTDKPVHEEGYLKNNSNLKLSI